MASSLAKKSKNRDIYFISKVAKMSILCLWQAQPCQDKVILAKILSRRKDDASNASPKSGTEIFQLLGRIEMNKVPSRSFLATKKMPSESRELGHKRYLRPARFPLSKDWMNLCQHRLAPHQWRLFHSSFPRKKRKCCKTWERKWEQMTYGMKK